jgi:ubiquinone/menaquinone biosynthesis C-methylase UbiE
LKRHLVEKKPASEVCNEAGIQLVPDKAIEFREIARVLRRGGRTVISDVVLDAPLPEIVAADVYAYTGCISQDRSHSTRDG